MLYVPSFICALVGVVFPAYIIFKLHKQIPNFLSVSNSVTKDTRHFYQRPPSIEPRRDLKTFEILQLQSIQWSSIRTERCYIYDCTCNRCTCNRTSVQGNSLIKEILIQIWLLFIQIFFVEIPLFMNNLQGFYFNPNFEKYSLQNCIMQNNLDWSIPWSAQ